jgi:23S rRNA (adenine2030-N6)-methyltransferase
MNYRHAYHAGNFADVMKHALVARILAHLLKKPAAFRVIDTHAGIGLYDLSGEEASKTGEWRSGVGVMDASFSPEVEEVLEPWRHVVAALRIDRGPDAYPGSPGIIRAMLRAQDRAILVEKHPQDHATLAAEFRHLANVKVVHLDGWAALAGFVPPKERRGLVLIDPPFEEPDEFARCAARFGRALKRWPTGIVALWYPVKHEKEVAALGDAISAAVTARTLRLELHVAPADGTRLAGSGLIVANPPFTLEDDAGRLLPALVERFGGTGFVCEELVPEAA